MKFFFLSLLFLGLLTDCTHSNKTPKPLRVQLGGTPISLDPAMAEDGLSLRVLANVMEGLVGYDGSGRLQNFLASKVEVSSDYKIYEYSIRPEAKWSDGRPVLAQDFVRGLRRSLSPATASRLADSLEVLRGAREFRKGTTSELPGVREQNGKLILELERPVSYFLQILTLSVAMPVRQDVLDSHQGRWPEGEKLIEAPVTGPYRFSKYLHEQKIILERNPNYWGWSESQGSNGFLPPEKVEMLIVADESTGVNLFDQGMLDILTKVPSLDFQRKKSQNLLRTEPFLATYFIGFNCQKPPFNNSKARKAFSASIRRKEIVEALMSGEVPAGGWIPRGLEGSLSFDESKIESPTSAVILPKAAPIPLQYDGSERNRLVIEKVEQDVKKSLGLKLSLVNLDWKTHVKSIQTDPPPLFRFAWQTPFADPAFLLGIFTRGNPNNLSRWSNAEYERLIGEIEILSPGPKREALIRSAQKILIEDEAVIAPLYYYVQNYAISPRIKNFHVNPFGVIRFNELEVNDARDQ